MANPRRSLNMAFSHGPLFSLSREVLVRCPCGRLRRIPPCCRLLRLRRRRSFLGRRRGFRSKPVRSAKGVLLARHLFLGARRGRRPHSHNNRLFLETPLELEAPWVWARLPSQDSRATRQEPCPKAHRHLLGGSRKTSRTSCGERQSAPTISCASLRSSPCAPPSRCTRSSYARARTCSET